MTRPPARGGRAGALPPLALALHLALAGAILLGGPGCGGGGGPTAPPPPPPVRGITFTAAGTPGDMTIYLAKRDGTANNVLVLELRVQAITDLYGVGFDLAYPDGLLDWNSGAEAIGPFLTDDGERTELLVEERPAGNLIVGLSRLGDVGGIDGSGELMTLQFTASADGSGSFTFSDNDAFDSTGDRLDDTEWLAGDVEIDL